MSIIDLIKLQACYQDPKHVLQSMKQTIIIYKQDKSNRHMIKLLEKKNPTTKPLSCHTKPVHKHFMNVILML